MAANFGKRAGYAPTAPLPAAPRIVAPAHDAARRRGFPFAALLLLELLAVVFAVVAYRTTDFATLLNPSARMPAATGLIADGDMPKDMTEGAARAKDLLARYPRDPRAHLYRAVAFLTADHDLSDAEEQLHQALAMQSRLGAEAASDFAKRVTVVLAIVVAYEGKPDEAKTLGAPLCGFAARDEAVREIYGLMQQKGLCG